MEQTKGNQEFFNDIARRLVNKPNFVAVAGGSSDDRVCCAKAIAQEYFRVTGCQVQIGTDGEVNSQAAIRTFEALPKGLENNISVFVSRNDTSNEVFHSIHFDNVGQSNVVHHHIIHQSWKAKICTLLLMVVFLHLIDRLVLVEEAKIGIQGSKERIERMYKNGNEDNFDH